MAGMGEVRTEMSVEETVGELSTYLRWSAELGQVAVVFWPGGEKIRFSPTTSSDAAGYLRSFLEQEPGGYPHRLWAVCYPQADAWICLGRDFTGRRYEMALHDGVIGNVYAADHLVGRRFFTGELADIIDGYEPKFVI